VSGWLGFEIDTDQLHALIDELGLTERQAKFALSRALRRTATTLRVMSERGLKSELDVRKLTYLRRRLRFSRMNRGNFEGARLWFGTGDMPISALRGRIAETGDGAAFSGKAGSQSYAGGFVAKSKRGWTANRKTIFARKGGKRLPIAEAQLPVQDTMDVFIEDQVFDQVDRIFWNHFERDMMARARGFGRRE